ncbi:uncharacterized protein [Medicago truncatula]|uniref:Octicosapeptide/phox/Bem1p (PB1) domain protein n=1 Tax=Medicago truncatula TaxID=3880 RepID=G7K313_MEDTR|nr:uncharacterized protein LOC11431398 [Medicago truncatula]XP_039690696.1 uncharacterized protein LOC120580694 [Medicago truncatula]AET00078.1 octicosapeptide/phox/Bem1p (PB1) domain protein [Medicago truncatula]AET00083.1 octicosapeptide/phox/Bem1p (PB1) domain protein [Medicago truncatula]KEH28349.1 octicosapeptide/phox/Bem1p (PB1) domain protein [Medicago truncatula]
MERVKLMITYGGKIQPRLTALHDHRRYSYIGGDNKIITVDRNINFSDLMAKLSTFMFSDVCFKYQLLGEDLDALIPVYNEEDLNHMMFEYDRMCRFSQKPAWLRVFLFPVPINNNKASFDSLASVDSLNSVQVFPFEEYSSPPTTPPHPFMATKDTVTKAEMKKFCGIHVVNDEFEDILKLYLKRNFSKVKDFQGLHVVNDEFEDILKSFWKRCFLKPNIVF